MDMNEKLFGWTIDEIREWLGDNPSDERLATAFAAVDSNVVDLMHGVAEDDWPAEEYVLWWDYCCELYSLIIKRQDAACDRYDTSFGMQAAVVPFMYRNGYLESSGRWIARDECESGATHVSITNTQLDKSEKALLAGLIGKRLEWMRSDDVPLAIELICDDAEVVLTNQKEPQDPKGGAEEVPAFHVTPTDSLDEDHWFHALAYEPLQAMRIGQRIENVLVVEEREERGSGTGKDSIYSYTKALCLALEEGLGLLLYRDQRFGGSIRGVLDTNAMSYLPSVGDEADRESGEGGSVQRATVSLAGWPKPQVVRWDHARL